MTDREIQQAMDACRPGGEDLPQPELAALARAVENDPELRRRLERSQRFDAAVMGRFRKVPVPAGLADRLLAAVDGADGQPAAGDSAAGQTIIEPHSVRHADAPSQSAAGSPVHGSRQQRRRVWTIAASSLATIAALVAFLLLVPYFRVAEPRVDDRLPGEVWSWTDAVVREGWKTDFDAPQLRDRPLDRAIRPVPQRWCSISTAYDPDTVVYDVSSHAGELALVFCMRARVRTSQLPEVPPWNGFAATGGLTLGVWRRGDMVYVLAVRGGASRYRALLGAPPLIGWNLDGRPFLLTMPA